MLFTYNTYNDVAKGGIRVRAYNIILRFPKKATEKALDKYLKENYNLTLVQACFKLARAAKITFDSETTYLITFPTKKLDELASFITYGNREILGSQILREAFSKSLPKERRQKNGL